MANENMTTSKNGLNFISRWEGCVLHPYLDVASYWTIGIGKLILPTDSFSTISNSQIRTLLATKDKNNSIAKIQIPHDEALDLLKYEVEKCESAIKSNIKVDLTQGQFDALVSWSFNCGVGVLKTSSLSLELNKGNYDVVPAKLLDWCKARVNGVVVVNQGLKNRRISEGELWSKQDEQIEPAPLFTDQEKNNILASIYITSTASVGEVVSEHEDDNICNS